MKEKFKEYLERKSKFGIAADLLIVFLLISFLIPPARMAIMTFLVKGRMLVLQPSIDTEDGVMLVDSDYQMSLKDLKGQDFEFSSLKGKVIFLNFWATWCPPCVAEMPAIQELYNLYKDNSNVAFLLVGSESPEEIKKYINKNGYTFPVYIQNGRSPKVLSSSSIPSTFVISKAGMLVVREVGAVNWAGERMVKIMESLVK